MAATVDPQDNVDVVHVYVQLFINNCDYYLQTVPVQFCHSDVIRRRC